MTEDLQINAARGFQGGIRWPLVRMGSVASLHYGKALKAGIRKDGGVPVYGSNGQCGWHDTPLKEGPSVILGRKGQGPLGVEWCPSPFWVIDTAYYVTVDSSRIDLRYFYFLTKYVGLNHLKDGTSNPSLSRDVFGFQGIPLPPMPIQLRIVRILSAYDELIENSQRRIQILEQMARNLYREWFVNFRFPGHAKTQMVDSPLWKIPKGWEVKKLAELTSYLNRGLAPSYDDNGDSVVVNQKCIREQRLNLEPSRRQAKAVPPDKLIRFGDVLINSTGVGTLGRVAQVYQDFKKCTVDTHVTIARPNKAVDLDFFGCALLSQELAFERLGVGATGQTELSRTSIAGIEMVVPSPSCQTRFGENVRPLRFAAVTLENQIQNLSKTRDLLLPRLLSGQINTGRLLP